MNISDQEQQLIELAKTDPTIHYLLLRHYRGELEWNQMLFEGVIALQYMNKELCQDMLKLIQNSTRPYVG